MKESVLRDKSENFAIRIVNLCKYLCDKKKEFILSKQILRSGTSIGANLAEAEFATSKSDFIAKVHISMKECSETLYWLRLLKNTGYITEKWFIDISAECNEIGKMLTASIKTAKDSLRK